MSSQIIFLIYFYFLLALLVISTALPRGKIIHLKASPFQMNSNVLFRWNSRLIFILFLIGLFAGLRDKALGIDYSGYVEFYEYIVEHQTFMPGPLIGVEFGWNYLNLFFGKLGLPTGIFFGIVTAITWAFFIKGSFRFQHLLPLMFFFSLVTGFFFWTLSGLRQSIAIMIYFYAIKFIIEKNLFKYVVTVLLASMFHVSILLMLPMYILKNIKYNRNVGTLLFLVSLGFIGSNLFVFLADIILTAFGHIEFLKFYTHYLEDPERLQATENHGSNLGFLLKTVFSGFILFRCKKILSKHSELNIYYVFFAFYAILNNLFFSIELVHRFLNYFYVCFPIVAAAHVYYSANKFEKLASILFLSVFSLQYLVTTYKYLLILLFV